jgi:hypothetical protein
VLWWLHTGDQSSPFREYFGVCSNGPKGGGDRALAARLGVRVEPTRAIGILASKSPLDGSRVNGPLMIAADKWGRSS